MEKKYFKNRKINYKGFLGADPALKELETNPSTYDIIFVDVHYACFSGIALVQYIKTHENKKIHDCFCVPIVGSIAKKTKQLFLNFIFMKHLLNLSLKKTLKKD